MSKSIVEYYREQEKHRCGYCRQPDTNYCHGMWAHSLTVKDYQNLIDRGWRRSGKYCYKPTMKLTCCPLYTIRCNILDFKLSKSQKKLLKKVNKYLTSGENTVDDSEMTSDKCKINDPNRPHHEGNEDNAMNVAKVTDKPHSKINMEGITLAVSCDDTEMKQNDDTGIKIDNKQDSKIQKGNGPDANNKPCKKKKLMRMERKLEKLKAKGEDPSMNVKCKPSNQDKSLEDFIIDLPETSRNKLQLKLVRTSPPSDEWKATSTVTHALYTKYQMAIHGDSVEKCTRSQFEGFLVKSPLQAEYTAHGPASGYGSFHQQYWLEDELIAVGVIDILPMCVSSVYFFYDPKYSNLTLGTYGALRELAFTRKLQSTSPNLKFYYMGYYIHSCPKMRYKGNYHPSYLLCPETYSWYPIEDCRLKLENTPYLRLNTDIDAIDTNDCEEKDLGNILVLNGNTYMKYRDYKTHKQFIINALSQNSGGYCEEMLLEYAKLVGKICSQNMILIKE